VLETEGGSRRIETNGEQQQQISCNMVQSVK